MAMTFSDSWNRNSIVGCSEVAFPAEVERSLRGFLEQTATFLINSD